MEDGRPPNIQSLLLVGQRIYWITSSVNFTSFTPFLPFNKNCQSACHWTCKFCRIRITHFIKNYSNVTTIFKENALFHSNFLRNEFTSKMDFYNDFSLSLAPILEFWYCISTPMCHENVAMYVAKLTIIRLLNETNLSPQPPTRM